MVSLIKYLSKLFAVLCLASPSLLLAEAEETELNEGGQIRAIAVTGESGLIDLKGVDGSAQQLKVESTTFAPISNQEFESTIAAVEKAIESELTVNAAVQIRISFLKDFSLSENQLRQAELVLIQLKKKFPAAENLSIELPEGAHTSFAELSNQSQQLITNSDDQQASQLTETWFKAQKENLRFSLIRFSLNATVVSVGMIMSGVPLAAALPVGITAGVLSGVFQATHEVYLPWVAKEGILHQALTQIPGISPKLATSINVQLKWGSLEVAFLAAINIVRIATGAGPEYEGGLFEGLKLLATSGVAVAAQAPWEAYFHRRKEQQLESAATAVEEKRIKVNSQRAIMMTSMLSVSAAVAQMMGVDILSYTIFGAMIGGGINPQLTGKWFSLTLGRWLGYFGNQLQSFCGKLTSSFHKPNTN